MKKLVALLMMVVMVFAFAGCGEEVQTSFAVGETAVFDDVSYTLTDVTYSNGDEWDTPDEGKEYVIVHLTIENGSDEKISYNEFDWAMVNSDGQEDTSAIVIFDIGTEELSSGDLAPGGKKSGAIVFEEPKDDEGLKLLYYSNFLFDEEPTFEFVL